MIPDCTLATAIYPSNNAHHVARTIQETVNACEALLSIPIYLAIYGNKDTIPLLKQARANHGLEKITAFYEIEREDLWSFQQIDKVRENRKVYWPSRDSRNDENIHLLQCNKSDFVLQTIEKNPFNTTKFGWTDAFLGKDTIRICEQYDKNVLPRILCQISDKFKIQVLNICDKRFKEAPQKREYYETYRWVVCGGFFTCGIETGKKVLKRQQEIFLKTTAQGYGHGEEMLFLELLDEFEDDIEKSYGDYGQMWNNFIEPTRNLHYVYYMILHNYWNYGYYKECYYCGKTLVKAIESHTTDVTWNIYMLILVDLYNATRRCVPEEATPLARKILDLCEKHPGLRTEYLKNAEHYRWLFT
jgi:S-adenosylmethionine/arginine decarboxylase-like enzyme